MARKSQKDNFIRLLILGSVITFLFILVPFVLIYSAESNTFILFIVLGGFFLFGILVVIIREFNRNDEINNAIKIDESSDVYFKKHCDSISQSTSNDFREKHYVKKDIRGENFYTDDGEEKLFSLNTRDYDLNNYRKL